MKNFGLPKTNRVSGYTWVQIGISSFTGNAQVQNHFYDGESLGAVVHFNERNSIWIQETFNKIVTSPWYTTTSTRVYEKLVNEYTVESGAYDQVTPIHSHSWRCARLWLPRALPKKPSVHLCLRRSCGQTRSTSTVYAPGRSRSRGKKPCNNSKSWGRFQLVESPRGADLVFLFSGNPYLGDYLTRDGPDTRPVFIESTIMTVIDANTGGALWTDSRRWGSWRVAGATKDLIDELKDLMASQVRKWTLNDLLMCGVAPVYKPFDHLTPEEAMKSGAGVSAIPNKPDRLSVELPVAPGFCRSSQLVVGPEGKIVGFEVSASLADDLDIDEVLQHADRFDFNGGKYSNGDTVYFSAAKQGQENTHSVRRSRAQIGTVKRLLFLLNR